jgi:hypothetical protein
LYSDRVFLLGCGEKLCGDRAFLLGRGENLCSDRAFLLGRGENLCSDRLFFLRRRENLFSDRAFLLGVEKICAAINAIANNFSKITNAKLSELRTSQDFAEPILISYSPLQTENAHQSTNFHQ